MRNIGEHNNKVLRVLGNEGYIIFSYNYDDDDDFYYYHCVSSRALITFPKILPRKR